MSSSFLKSAFVISSLGGLLLFPTASAATKKVEAYVMSAPTVPMEGINSISFQLGGQQGTVLQSALFNLAKNPNIGKDTNWLTGKTKPHPMLETQIDPLTLSVTQSGGDASLQGSAGGSAQDSVESEQKTDREGKSYTLWCAKRVATLSYTVKMNHGNSVLLDKSDQDEIMSSSCNRESAAKAKAGLASAQDMLKAISQRLAVRILAEIRPTWRTQVYLLQKDRSVKKGNGILAKKGNVGGALGEYLGVAEDDPYNFAALHNAGVAYEMAGSFSKAQEFLDRACKLGEPDLCAKSKERLSGRINEADTLMTMGLTVRGEPSITAGGGAATKKIAGNKKKRVVVLTSTGADADVLTQVPGGLSVEVIGEENGYVKIKLPDGAVGYVKKSQVK